MRKYIFVLLVLSLLLAGCSAEYNLEIDEDSFKESVNIYYPKSEFTKAEINNIVASKTPITQDFDQIEFYNNSVKENSQNYIVNENYIHSIDTISDSYIITTCYSGNVIKKEYDKLIIETEDEFGCIYADAEDDSEEGMDVGVSVDHAVINITTKLKVISNNADTVNNNTYTWNIDKENYQNKPIYMEIQLDERNQIVGAFQIQLGLILLAVILIFGCIFFYLNKKSKKNNSI